MSDVHNGVVVGPPKALASVHQRGDVMGVVQGNQVVASALALRQDGRHIACRERLWEQRQTGRAHLSLLNLLPSVPISVGYR